MSEALPFLGRSPGLILVVCSVPRQTYRLVKEFRRAHRPSPVIVLSDKCDHTHVTGLLEAGAFGLISRFDKLDEVRRAVRTVLAGAIHISSTVVGGMHCIPASPGERTESTKIETLSRRELEVFLLVGKGLCGKEIASKLGISIKTVETHKYRIKEKLCLRNASQLVNAATYHGVSR